MSFIDDARNAILNAQANKGPEFSELDKLKQKQTKAAEDFRNNQKGMQEEQDRVSRTTARQELAQNLSNIRSNSNARGLLYSGLKQASDVGAEQNQRARVASDSANTAARLEDQARGLEDQATNTGIALQGARQGQADQEFSNSLANRQARDSAISGISQGVGSIAGAYIGRPGSTPAVQQAAGQNVAGLPFTNTAKGNSYWGNYSLGGK